MTGGACLSFTKSVPESEILVPDACADARESALQRAVSTLDTTDREEE